MPDRTTDRFNQIQAEKKQSVLQTKEVMQHEETLGDGRIRIPIADGNVTFKENPAPAPSTCLHTTDSNEQKTNDSKLWKH